MVIPNMNYSEVNKKTLLEEDTEKERQKKIEEYLAQQEKELAELRQEATNSNVGYSNPDRDDQFDGDDDY